MFKLLYKSSVSACFELENNDVYFTNEYQIKLNGEYHSTSKVNVFSLFDLKANTEYTVEALGFELKFTTKTETTVINVKSMGALGDGETDDTKAIQYAMDCSAKNGRVVVPAGKYYCSALVVPGDITLELKKDAVILGHIKEEEYKILPGVVLDDATGEEIFISSWEGDPMECHLSLISSFRKENINIVGEGTLDGNAQNSTWWFNHKARTIHRPRGVFVNQCKNFAMHGVTMQNSASWQLHPYFSQDVSFLDVKILAPSDSPNTDGCDPESCDDVKIIGCVFSVGDDCIAIKAGKMAMGMKYKTPASNHIIRNCLMQFGHGGVVLGSEMSGGVKDLTVKQCYFNETDRGLRIKTRRGRGKYAIIDGVLFENIVMDNVKAAFVINMFYFCDFDGRSEFVQTREPQPIDDGTPYLGKFKFKDIKCTDIEYACGYFDGLPEQPIDSIEFENVDFHIKPDAEAGFPAMLTDVAMMSKVGFHVDNVNKISFKGIKVDGIEGETYIIKNVGEVTYE